MYVWSTIYSIFISVSLIYNINLIVRNIHKKLLYLTCLVKIIDLFVLISHAKWADSTVLIK